MYTHRNNAFPKRKHNSIYRPHIYTLYSQTHVPAQPQPARPMTHGQTTHERRRLPLPRSRLSARLLLTRRSQTPTRSRRSCGRPTSARRPPRALLRRRRLPQSFFLVVLPGCRRFGGARRAGRRSSRGRGLGGRDEGSSIDSRKRRKRRENASSSPTPYSLGLLPRLPGQVPRPWGRSRALRRWRRDVPGLRRDLPGRRALRRSGRSEERGGPQARRGGGRGRPPRQIREACARRPQGRRRAATATPKGAAVLPSGGDAV